MRDDAQPVPQWLIRIVHRGLSFEPAMRFGSVCELADALKRGLGRRRRIAGAFCTTAMLATGAWVWSATPDGNRHRPCVGASEQLAGIWDDARQAVVRDAVLGIEASYAEGAWALTADGLERYASDWVAMRTAACEATAVRGEQSPDLMDRRMKCLDRAKIELAAVVAVLADADSELLPNLHKTVTGLPPLARCADVDALQADVEPPLPQERETVDGIRVLLADAKAQRSAGRLPSARERISEARTRLDGLKYERVRAELLLEDGEVAARLGEYDRSEQLYRKAMELSARLRQWGLLRDAATSLMFVVGVHQQRAEEALGYRELAQGAAAGDLLATVDTSNVYAAVLARAGRYAEAEAEFRRALELGQDLTGHLGPHQLALLRSGLANVLAMRGDYENAELEQGRVLETLERELGRYHPLVADQRADRAATFSEQGKTRAAQRELRKAIALGEMTLGPAHPDVALWRSNLAQVLMAMGRYDSAQQELDRSLAVQEEILGSDHPEVAYGRLLRGNILVEMGAYRRAEEVLRDVLPLMTVASGPRHSGTASVHLSLGLALKQQEKYREAHSEIREAVAIYGEALGPEHPKAAYARSCLAGVLKDRGRLDEAESEYEQALETLGNSVGPEHPWMIELYNELADLRLGRGDLEAALRWSEAAWRQRQRTDSPPLAQAETAFLRARVLWAQAEVQADHHEVAQQLRASALKLASRAIDAFARAATNGEEEKAVATWIRERQ